MAEGQSSETSNAGRDDLRLLYQLVVQDLTFFKQQQWATTNYVLLLYAALVGIVQVTGATTKGWERVAVCILAGLACAAGIRVLVTLERSMNDRRDRFRPALERFSPEFREIWVKPPTPAVSSSIALMLGATMVVGAMIVCWLTWRNA